MFRHHFSKETLRKMDEQGIEVIGLTSVPGDGHMPWANSTTAYKIVQDGCLKIRTPMQLEEMLG